MPISFRDTTEMSQTETILLRRPRTLLDFTSPQSYRQAQSVFVDLL